MYYPLRLVMKLLEKQNEKTDLAVVDKLPTKRTNGINGINVSTLAESFSKAKIECHISNYMFDENKTRVFSL